MPSDAQFEDDYHKRYRKNPLITLFGQRGPMLRRIRRAVPEGTLIDIGCGQGWWLRDASRYYKTSGADVSHFALGKAGKNVPSADLRLITSAAALPFETGIADVLTCWDVIEHVLVPETYFAEFFRILKSDGILVFSTPNPNCISAKVKPEDWHGARDATHISMKPANAWIEMVQSHGFRVERVIFDWLWDVPYFGKATSVSGKLLKILEHGVVQLPSVLAFNIGLRCPESLGENIYIMATKDQR